MLEEQGQQWQHLSEALKHPTATRSGSFPSFQPSPRHAAVSPVSWKEETDDSSTETQFLVPPGHSATLVWLLSLPTLSAVLGDFTKSYFYGLEESTALPHALDPFQSFPLDWPPLQPARLRELADAYFNKTSSHLPLLTRQFYEELQESMF